MFKFILKIIFFFYSIIYVSYSSSESVNDINNNTDSENSTSIDESEQYLIPYLIKRYKDYNKPIVCTGTVEMDLPEECLTKVPDMINWKKTIVLGDVKWYDDGEKWLKFRNAYLEWWGRYAELSMGLTNQHELFSEALEYWNLKKIHMCEELKNTFTTEMLEMTLLNQYYTESGDIFSNYDEFGVLRFFSMAFCKKIWIIAHSSWAAHPYLQFTFQTMAMPINLKVEWEVVRLGWYWDFFLWNVETNQMGLTRENVSYMLWSLQGHISPEVREYVVKWSHYYLRTKYPNEYVSKEISYCYINNEDNLAHIAKCIILWYDMPFDYNQVTYTQLIDLDLIF